MQLSLIVTPAIENAGLCRIAKEFLELNLDGRGLPAHVFLKNLSIFKGTPHDIFNPGAFLSHLSYSVLVKAAPAFLANIQAESVLASTRSGVCVDGEQLMVSSGNLNAFRSEVLNGCSGTANPNFAEYTTQLLCLFDKQGLGTMFNEYDRRIKPNTNSLILSASKRP